MSIAAQTGNRNAGARYFVDAEGDTIILAARRNGASQSWTNPVAPPSDDGRGVGADLAMSNETIGLRQGTLVWPPAMFTLEQGSDLGPASLIDLTGRARLLLSSPRTTLDPGTWRISLEMLLEPGSASAHLQFGWGPDGGFKIVSTTVRGAGIYAIELEAEWIERGEAVLGIGTSQPHFHGECRLMGCKLNRIERREMTVISSFE